MKLTCCQHFAGYSSLTTAVFGKDTDPKFPRSFIYCPVASFRKMFYQVCYPLLVMFEDNIVFLSLPRYVLIGCHAHVIMFLMMLGYGSRRNVQQALNPIQSFRH